MKQLLLIGMSQLLFGCGVINAPLADIGYGTWASVADISSSANIATIQGESRQLVTTYVKCRINHPVRAERLTFDAGRMSVAVKCTDGYGKSEHGYFNFEASSGHEYLIRMYVAPWNRSIVLVDVTDDETVVDSTS
ncbi:MAG: hypothetical protein GTO41_20460 [Burkholderiales bacterium]|nr:hypothetical protein [Burkholderiales bacterium]